MFGSRKGSEDEHVAVYMRCRLRTRSGGGHSLAECDATQASRRKASSRGNRFVIDCASINSKDKSFAAAPSTEEVDKLCSRKSMTKLFSSSGSRLIFVPFPPVQLDHRLWIHWSFLSRSLKEQSVNHTKKHHKAAAHLAKLTPNNRVYEHNRSHPRHTFMTATSKATSTRAM